MALTALVNVSKSVGDNKIWKCGKEIKNFGRLALYDLYSSSSIISVITWGRI
jgi:hypothetical protein